MRTCHDCLSAGPASSGRSWPPCGSTLATEVRRTGDGDSRCLPAGSSPYWSVATSPGPSSGFRLDFPWPIRSGHRSAHTDAPFLAANGGRAYNVAFVPTNLLAYLGPAGIRFTDVFPFVTLPDSPPTVVGNVVLDMTYRTASAPASMPLLFLLACGGIFAAFRRRPSGRARLVCIPLFAAACGTVGVLVWGYIANRYLSDFLPLLLLASCVGLVDLWHRVKVPQRRARRVIVCAVCVLALLSITFNLGIASTPADSAAWQGSRVQNYVHLQESMSNVTGNPIGENVRRGSTLPAGLRPTLSSSSTIVRSSTSPTVSTIDLDTGVVRPRRTSRVQSHATQQTCERLPSTVDDRPKPPGHALRPIQNRPCALPARRPFVSG